MSNLGAAYCGGVDCFFNRTIRTETRPIHLAFEEHLEHARYEAEKYREKEADMSMANGHLFFFLFDKGSAYARHLCVTTSPQQTRLMVTI